MKNLYVMTALLLVFSGFSQTIGLQSFATGLSNPLDITNAGDSRLFVVQQGGSIRIINADGTIKPTPFLNLASIISSDGERGLLGLAFHPNYATNGYFYVNYTNTAGNTVIARYSVSTINVDVANAASAEILLTITQPFSNHNGGTLKFGPDGYLYIGMGDGGSGGDPGNRAQNKNELLGKMLRIDVNTGTPYGIPANNPFVGVDGSDEIWAIGLRNPWKFSFDSSTGDLWIADVGQGVVEEINKVAATTAGLNYGWKCYEGNEIYTPNCAVAGTTYTFPLAQYTHAETGGCSITGGYVYRGTTYPNFVGKYLFADYCSNKIGIIGTAGTISWSAVFADNNFSTFGVDMNNELYVAGISSGTVYKVIDSSLGLVESTSSIVSLYPNPAATNVTITTANVTYPLQLTVTDMSGKRIITNTIDNEVAQMDVSGLQSGLYLVNIQDFSGINTTSKLTIN